MPSRRQWSELRDERLAQQPELRAAYEQAKRDLQLGELIRNHRKARGITQRELAERMGTTQSVIARLEAGGRTPSLPTLERLAKALGEELVINIGPSARQPAGVYTSADQKEEAHPTGQVGAAVGTPPRVGEASPSGGQVKQQVKRSAGLAKENPLGLAIGAAAIGFLAGLAVPSTRVEDEKLGPVADQVKDKVKETGQEALDRGKQVAQEVASAAPETAKERTQEHGQELADSAKQAAEDTPEQARQRAR